MTAPLARQGTPARPPDPAPTAEGARLPALDLEFARRAWPLLKLLQRYFRGEVFGLDRLPAGRAILAGNHNGGITTFEPLLLGMAFHEHAGLRDGLYFLGHDVMMALPLLGGWLARLGMVRADPTNAERLLAAGHKIAVFPGGNYEAFRPHRERHRVDFGGHVGYVRVALRTGAPIVPVMCLGGHDTFVVLTRGSRLARWTGVKARFRSDSFPLFLGLPWGLGIGPIFHLPLPAKLVIECGDPLDVSGYGPERAGDRALLQELSAEVQRRIQSMIDRRVTS